MYIPRIGQEVIVEFLEGDPDRPIITGRVYNDKAMPPYELPSEKTKSTIKSNSSKGGGGFNEIRFEDKKGDEQIFIHAEKDLHIRVKNDRRELIGHDRHLIVENDKFEHVENERSEIVGKSHFEEIGEDRDLTVKGEEDKEVQKDLTLTVKGNVDETFKKNHTEETTDNYTLKADKVTIEAKTKIELKVGGSTITLEMAQIEIKAPKISINGSAMTEVKGGIVKIN
jgi:type VI secretion system secreted protein VgrG